MPHQRNCALFFDELHFLPSFVPLRQRQHLHQSVNSLHVLGLNNFDIQSGEGPAGLFVLSKEQRQPLLLKLWDADREVQRPG